MGVGGCFCANVKQESDVQRNIKGQCLDTVITKMPLIVDFYFKVFLKSAVDVSWSYWRSIS